MKNLNKLNRETLIEKIERIELKLENRKSMHKHIINERIKPLQGEAPSEEIIKEELRTLEDWVFGIELDIFLMEEQIKSVKTILINNEVSEF
jgi:hypothetical protein